MLSKSISLYKIKLFYILLPYLWLQSRTLNVNYCFISLIYKLLIYHKKIKSNTCCSFNFHRFDRIHNMKLQKGINYEN